MDNTKHIFLHDRGLVGRRGGEFFPLNCLTSYHRVDTEHLPSFSTAAQFAIDSLTPSTVEVSLGHNSLQSEGIIAFFSSLRSLRSQWRSSTGGQWGIEKLTLSSNRITGEALAGIAEYLMDDCIMKELYLPHNEIEVSREEVSRGLARLLMLVLAILGANREETISKLSQRQWRTHLLKSSV